MSLSRSSRWWRASWASRCWSRPVRRGDYFSWELGPPPLASLVGGLYVASTVVFGLAISKSWGAVRGLMAGVLALTLPTLTATLIHSEVFDFSRAVAVIWLILFVASPLTYGSILVLRRAERVAGGPELPGGARLALGTLAVVLAAFGLLTWVDRTAAEELVPFALAPMGAKFLGAWSLFLAVLAAWAAAGGRDEARIPLVGLLAYALGGWAPGCAASATSTTRPVGHGWRLSSSSLRSPAACWPARPP